MTQLTTYGFNYNPVVLCMTDIARLDAVNLPAWAQDEVTKAFKQIVPGHCTITTIDPVVNALLHRLTDSRTDPEAREDLSREVFELSVKMFTIVTPFGVYSCSYTAAVKALHRYVADIDQCRDIIAEALQTADDMNTVQIKADNEYVQILTQPMYTQYFDDHESLVNAFSNLFLYRGQYNKQGCVLTFPDDVKPLQMRNGYHRIEDPQELLRNTTLAYLDPNDSYLHKVGSQYHLMKDK